MKIAFLSCFHDGTGYARSALDFALCLDSIGMDVVARSCKMTNTSGEVPDRFKYLENKDLDNIDTFIQYNLPSEFIYKSGVRNIGIFAYETNSIISTNWQENLELMDDIIVLCNQNKNNLIKDLSSLENKIHVVHNPCNIDKYNNQYDLMDFGLPLNCVKFYTIGELNRRKNLTATLLAYYSKFDSQDNVVLIIKTNGGSSKKYVKTICDELKSNTNRFVDKRFYPPVIVIDQYLSENNMASLHQSSDIFVTSSHGESACIPAIDAWGFGNHVIAPADGAFLDYIDDISVGSLIPGTYSTVVGESNVPDGLYTAEEQWFNVNIETLGESMMYAYKNGHIINSIDYKNHRRKHFKSKFSYHAVGKKLRSVLEKTSAITA